MGGVPHLNTAARDQTVCGDQPASKADLDGVGVDGSADLDLVPQRFWWNRVPVGVDGDERLLSATFYAGAVIMPNGGVDALVGAADGVRCSA